MTWYRGKISSFHTTTCLQNIEYEPETIMMLTSFIKFQQFCLCLCMMLTCFIKFQQFCLCLCLCCHIYQLLMILASDSEEASHLQKAVIAEISMGPKIYTAFRNVAFSASHIQSFVLPSSTLLVSWKRNQRTRQRILKIIFNH